MANESDTVSFDIPENVLIKINRFCTVFDQVKISEQSLNTPMHLKCICSTCIVQKNRIHQLYLIALIAFDKSDASYVTYARGHNFYFTPNDCVVENCCGLSKKPTQASGTYNISDAKHNTTFIRYGKCGEQTEINELDMLNKIKGNGDESAYLLFYHRMPLHTVCANCFV